MAEKRITRAGIDPVEDTVLFDITTEQMVAYLQRKLDVLLKDVNKTLADGVPKIPPITIRGYVTQQSKCCWSLIVTLPEEAILVKKPKNKTTINEENSMAMYMDPDDDDVNGKAMIYRPIYQFLRAYMWDLKPNDLNNADVRRSFELTPKSADIMRGFVQLRKKVFKRRKDNKKVTICLVGLNIINIVHDMLVWQNDDRQFTVIMHKDPTKLKNGSVQFRVTRSLRKAKKKNHGNDEYEAIMRQIENTSGL